MAVLGRKGSISVEFILLITISLVYIYAYVLPVMDVTSSATVDVKDVSDTRVAAVKLANAVDEAAAASGDTKRTISIYLPGQAELTCDIANSEIDYVVYLAPIEGNPLKKLNALDEEERGCVPIPDLASIEAWKCNASVPILSAAGSRISSCPPMAGQAFRDLVVEKRTDTDKIYVDWK